MINEANGDMKHDEMVCFIWHELDRQGYYVEKEQRLKNGRIADIIAEHDDGTTIVEVKSIFKMSLLEAAYGKYADLCDVLIVAAPPQRALYFASHSLITWPHDKVERIGLWQVTWDGIESLRPPKRLR